MLCALSGAQPVLAQTPAGFVPNDVRAYTAYRAPPGMAIDGRLDEDAWKTAPWTEEFVDIRDESHPAPTWETRAKLLGTEFFLDGVAVGEGGFQAVEDVGHGVLVR